MAVPQAPIPTSLFFYGTLMAPSVLQRVIGFPVSPKSSSPNGALRIRPALLHDHRRRRVRHADYPAVTPHDGSSVRGALVEGLRESDVRRLDLFEGEEYVRRVVKVRVLGDSDHETVENDNGQSLGGVDDGEGVESQTYIWIAPESELEEGEWDFEQFRREKLHLWDGQRVEDSGMRAVDELNKADQDTGKDGTRGRSAIGGEFERALQDADAS